MFLGWGYSCLVEKMGLLLSLSGFGLEEGGGVMGWGSGGGRWVGVLGGGVWASVL